MGLGGPRCSTVCERAGADWVKTSSGYGFVKQPDGSYVPTSVHIYDAVFESVEYTQTGFDAFSTAVDDARTVIAFIHDNEAPE